MSLGIASTWRAVLPHAPASRLTLIARVRPPLPLQARARHVTALPFSSQAATLEPSTGDNLNQHQNQHQPPPPPADRPETPGDTLIRHLTGLPVRYHGVRTSVLVKPFLSYPNPRETHRSRQEHRNSIFMQQRLEVIRIAKHDKLPDWRAVLKTLISLTPPRPYPWVQDAVKILLPPGASTILLDGVDTSIWEIAARSGALIKMIKAKDSDLETYLLVSGPKDSIQATVDDVLDIVRFGSDLSTPANTRDKSPLQAKAVPNRPQETEHLPERFQIIANSKLTRRLAPFQKYEMTVSAYDIEMPRSWTVQSFEHYIASLVNGYLPPQRASRLYPVETDHESAVVSLLHRAFNDDSLRTCFSASAFKMALRFLSARGHKLRPDARSLFVRAEMTGINFDAEFLDIMLLSAVKMSDLRSFHTTLRMMASRNILPTLKTWLLFMHIVESEQVRRYSLKAMHEKHLLDTYSAVKSVANEMACFDTDRARSKSLSLDHFLSEQQARYGPGWITTSSGNHVLEVLGRYGKFDESLKLIRIMGDRPQSRPDTISLNTVILHLKIQLQPLTQNLMSTLQKLSEQYEIEPDEITYHLLFEIGYNSNSPNVMAVVWRYACLYERASYRMRLRVSRFLEGSQSPEGSSGQNSVYQPSPTTFAKETILRELRKETHKPGFLGFALAHRFHARYHDHKPVKPFFSVLAEAVIKDGALRHRLKQRRDNTLDNRQETDEPERRDKAEPAKTMRILLRGSKNYTRPTLSY